MELVVCQLVCRFYSGDFSCDELDFLTEDDNEVQHHVTPPTSPPPIVGFESDEFFDEMSEGEHEGRYSGCCL